MRGDELRDVRPPLPLPSEWAWIGMALGVLFLGLLVWQAYAFWRARGKKTKPVIIKMSWEIALEALDGLQRGPLLREGKNKEYYSALSDIVRAYLEARFGIRAPEMTTEEFMDKARRAPELSSEQKDFLGGLLDASDRVKFAKFIPSMDLGQESLRLAREFVERTIPAPEPQESEPKEGR